MPHLFSLDVHHPPHPDLLSPSSFPYSKGNPFPPFPFPHLTARNSILPLWPPLGLIPLPLLSVPVTALFYTSPCCFRSIFSFLTQVWRLWDLCTARYIWCTVLFVVGFIQMLEIINELPQFSTPFSCSSQAGRADCKVNITAGVRTGNILHVWE